MGLASKTAPVTAVPWPSDGSSRMGISVSSSGVVPIILVPTKYTISFGDNIPTIFFVGLISFLPRSFFGDITPYGNTIPLLSNQNGFIHDKVIMINIDSSINWCDLVNALLGSSMSMIESSP